MRGLVRANGLQFFATLLFLVAFLQLVGCGDNVSFCQKNREFWPKFSCAAIVQDNAIKTDSAFVPLSWAMGTQSFLRLGDFILLPKQPQDEPQWMTFAQLPTNFSAGLMLNDGFFHVGEFHPLTFFSCSPELLMPKWQAILNQLNPQDRQLFANADRYLQQAISHRLKVNSCELHKALGCLIDSWEQVRLGFISSEVFGEIEAKAGRVLVSQVLQKAVSCVALQKANLPRKVVTSFYVSDRHVLFTPGSLVSVSIYAGRHNDYGDALRNLTPVAVIPIPASCPSLNQRCLQSPLLRSSCKGCEKLVSKQTYTAFLLEQKVQKQSTVRSFIFEHHP